MRKIFLIVYLIVISGVLLCQSQTNRPQNLIQLSQGNAVNKFIQNDPSIDVIGSPYLNEEFVDGWVLLKNLTDTTTDMKIRFNALDQTLEAEKTTNQYVRLSMPVIQSFGFVHDQEKLAFVNASKVYGIEGFPELLFNKQNVQILLLHECSKKTQEAQAYESNKESIHFNYSYSTYLIIDSAVNRVKNKKELNELLNSMGMKSKKIKNADLSDRTFLRKLGMEMIQQ